MVEFARIEILLADKGWSTRELLRRMDVNETSMRDWKRRNNIPADRLYQIAYLLDTTVEYLRGETDDPAIPDIKKTTPANVVAEAEAIRAVLEDIGLATPGVPIDPLVLEATLQVVRNNSNFIPIIADNIKRSKK